MMNFPRRWAVACAASLAMSVSSAEPSAELTTHTAIAALLQQSFSNEGPGAVVLVQRGKELLHFGAVGRANLELDQPLRPDSVLRIGSVTKQFASVLLLRQVAQGKASLQDVLDSYVPGFPNGKRITLEQLLNHTAGARNYTDIPGYMAGEARMTRSTQDMVQRLRSETPDFDPGKRWQYSNTGYVLIGAVLEKLTGQPWGVQLESLFKELGMQCSDSGAQQRVLPRLATGYGADSQGNAVPPAYIDLSQAQMAGAAASCAADLLRWNQALHGGRLLPDSLYERMTAPTPLKQPADYGLGIAMTTVQGRAALWHGGRLPGYTAMLLTVPEAQLHVVVMRNSDSAEPHVEPLAKRLAAIALGQPYPEPLVAPAPASPDPAMAGRYRSERDGVERLLRWQDGQWALQRPSYPPHPLLPLAGGSWQVGTTLGRLQRDDFGLLHFPDGDGAPERWIRVGSLPQEAQALRLTEAQMAALVGEYAGPQFSLRVFRDPERGLMAQAPGQPAVALEAETALRLGVKALGAMLEFELENGTAARVTLQQGAVSLSMQRR